MRQMKYVSHCIFSKLVVIAVLLYLMLCIDNSDKSTLSVHVSALDPEMFQSCQNYWQC